MGKKSKRVRNGGTPRAPCTLPDDVHPFFESEFRPIGLSRELRADDRVKTMRELVAGGMLSEWQLGRKGTHISSRFVSAGGAEDILTSPRADDQDYGSLVEAHLQQVFCVARQEMGEEAWKQVTGEETDDVVRNKPKRSIPAEVKKILDVLYNDLADNGGRFVRFKDGDTRNCRVDNLAGCSPAEAFKHPEWVVDWNANLDREQVAFVRANMANFAEIFA